MTELGFINYFESLAKNHALFAHGNNNRAFFYVESPHDLSEFDEGLRGMTSSVAFLLVASKGELDDNSSENHVDSAAYQIYILQKKGSSRSPREIFDFTKQRLLEIVARVKDDFRKATSRDRFSISEIQYEPVGPMADEWFGYTALLPFSCPFPVLVKAEIWNDKV